MLTDDEVRLHYEVAGSGTPILFIHEFAGDARSWKPQVSHFAQDHRCVVYDARGYPPSDVPYDAQRYSQGRAVKDACAVLDALQIERAHIVGLSMGGFCALHLGLCHPERVHSLVVAGCGYGSLPQARESFRRESEAIAEAFAREGSDAVAERYAVGPARVQLQNKNRVAWATFAAQLAEHSAQGMANTILGVQRERPSLYELREQLALLPCPVLIVAGDEDDGCLEADLMLKRVIPGAGLVVMPNTGHTCNLEEPELFNQTVARFIAAVEANKWSWRDPRSRAGSLTGIEATVTELKPIG